MHVLEVASAVPVGSLDGPALRGLTLQLERVRSAVDAAEAHAVAELDRRRHTDIRLRATTSKWLAQHANLPAGVARARLSLANRLATDLAVVDEALVDGRIGVDHARVFAGAVNERNLDAMAELIPDLVDAASAMEFDRWKDHVRVLGEMADMDGPHDPDADLLKNRLTLSESDHFGLIRGEFTADRFITIHDTLQSIADELFEQYTRDHNASTGELPVPPRSTLLALALEEMARRSLGVDPAASTGPKVEARLSLLAAPAFGDHRDNADASAGAGPVLPEHLELWGIRHRLLGPLPSSTVEHLLCDATWIATVLDEMGVPLDQGREQRFATDEQRIALDARDGNCDFAGCDAHDEWLDAHHIEHWDEHDGPSDLVNFATLCRRHHRVAHRKGWTLELTDDGWTIWTTPLGYRFWGQRHHHQRAGPCPERGGPGRGVGTVRAMAAPQFRIADERDVDELVELVERAYRGESSRAGWCTEADLLAGQRVDHDMMRAALGDDDVVVLVLSDDDGAVACCELRRLDDDRASLGMFAVDPGRQAGGLGRSVLEHAEGLVAQRWSVGRLELTVIDVRRSLIEWYERRGFERTGERRPFPYGDERFGVPQVDDLRFVVLEKRLAPTTGMLDRHV